MCSHMAVNIFKLITRFYGNLYGRKSDRLSLLSPVRRLTRIIASRLLPPFFRRNTPPKPILRCDNVIISLTSFPGRINDIWITISSLVWQSYQPYKIILWLSKDQFPSTNGLPSSLRSMESDLFEIRFVEGDLKSHKKYYYAFQNYPDKLVITVDDDLIYAYNMVELFYKEHLLHPDDVLCRYCKEISYNQNGELKPYNSWPVTTNTENEYIFFGSGGGVLFQPNRLFEDVLNKELFWKLTPYADDIWLNTMCRLANLRIRLVTKDLFLYFDKNEQGSLSYVNVELSKNDEQLNNVIQYYTSHLGINKIF